MVEERTYLELSEAGGSHKFYEIILNGAELTMRYGRIGDQGQTKITKYPDVAKAKADAEKKINEKLRKGYERAVMGVRKKRPVTRRSMTVEPPPASVAVNGHVSRQPVKNAPVLWRFDSGASAFGIFIDESLCWVGNEAGKIFALDHNGQVRAKFKLPDGVKCIVADDVWLYAGCDDGKVYDLSGKFPHVAYEIADDVNIFWLDINDGVLAVSDDKGTVTTINHEDESQWTRRSKGDRGWMVRADEIGIYHGHSAGVTMYDWEDGRLIWERETMGQVLFGWQEEDIVYACTNYFRVHSFAKNGEPGAVYVCDAPVFSCTAAEGGKYVFAGDNNRSIYCFDQAGERLWKLSSGCGSAYSMQFFKDRLFIVTTDGALACIDASEEAIKSAQAGVLPETVAITAPQVEETSVTQLETTSDRSRGVMVECYREGSKLRVRVISEGFDRGLHCQFPKGIREEGARYMVDEVRTARGGFYRAYGNIRKLQG